MSKIWVVNVKENKCTHFCGRKSSYSPYLHGIDFTYFGNPFTEGSRKEVVEKYGEYLYEKYDKGDPELLEYLEQIFKTKEHVKLGCFCEPKLCHCDHIVDLCQEYIMDKILITETT